MYLHFSLYFLLFFLILEIVILFSLFLRSIYKYFFLKELSLIDRYGEDTWAVITGGSSGQGRQFALKLAERGFNILFIGSHRSKNVMKEIKNLFPDIKVMHVYKNFCHSFKKNFFKDIEKIFNKLNLKISILINNVAHRTAWDPYHKMPVKLIKDTISCGTLVQAQLTHMIIPFFLKRSNKSAIINITAQCNHPNFGPGMILSNDISVPYLSVYEASNAFGYYHSNSIHKEYKNKIDILNITPGAVITENTGYLKNTLFSITSDKFVNNIIRFMGNVNGTTCGCWGHAISVYFVNLFPFYKDYILHQTGKTIAHEYMNNKRKKY